MNDRARQRLRAAAALAAVTLSLASCRMEARQEPTKETAAAATDFSVVDEKIDKLIAEIHELLGVHGDINIVLAGNGENIRLDRISRKVKGVCKNNTQADCENGVTWRLLGGNRLLTGWTVKIKETQTGSSKTGCFKSEYVLDNQTTSASSGPPDASCQNPGDIWRYDVILYNGTQPVGNPIDPLLLMYY